MKMRFFYLILLLTELSNFAFYIPYFLVKYAREGLPFAIVIGYFFIFLNQYFQLSFYNKYKNMNVVQIKKRLYGKLFGSIITIVSIIMRLTIANCLFTASIKLINQYLLFESSQWFLVLPLALLLLFVFSFKPRNFLYCKASFAVLAVIWVIILFIIGTRDMNFSYLRGTIIHSFHPPKLILIASVTFFFGGVQHLAIFNPEFREKISFRGTVAVNLLGGLPILIMAITIPLGIWGPEAVNRLSFVQAGTLDTMAIDMFFIERVLYIGIPLLFSLILFNVENFSYVAYNMLKELNPSGKLYVKSLPAVILSIFILTSIYVDFDLIVELFETFLKYWLFIFTLINSLTFTFAKLEGRRKA